MHRNRILASVFIGADRSGLKILGTLMDRSIITLVWRVSYVALAFLLASEGILFHQHVLH